MLTWSIIDSMLLFSNPVKGLWREPSIINGFILDIKCSSTNKDAVNHTLVINGKASIKHALRLALIDGIHLKDTISTDTEHSFDPL